MKKIIIVGGGLSGLSVGWRLLNLRPDCDIRVLEARRQVGGNIRTLNREGFRVETGPNGFLDAKRSTLELCYELGLRERLIPASEGSRKNRYLFWNDQLQRLPSAPEGILTTSLLSWSGKLRLLLEPLIHKRSQVVPEESVAAFGRRRLGREAQELFLDAIVTGIHAGDPELLSVRAAFPRLAQFEQQYGSVFRGFLNAAKERKQAALARGEPSTPTRMWSFREGLSVLIDTLRDRLGTRVQTGATVQRVAKSQCQWHVTVSGESYIADAVVLCSPSHEQARVLADFDPILADHLAAIPFNKIVVVALGYPQSATPTNLDGFGYIAPQRTQRDILGVQWCSSIFPDRAPPGMVLWRVLAGGVNRPDVADWPDDELLRRSHAELKQAMKLQADPVFHEIIRWPRAIPQYNLGHLARVDAIEQRASQHPGLFLTGNSFRGVAMNDVVEQANIIAQRLADSLAR